MVMIAQQVSDTHTHTHTHTDDHAGCCTAAISRMCIYISLLIIAPVVGVRPLGQIKFSLKFHSQFLKLEQMFSLGISVLSCQLTFKI